MSQSSAGPIIISAGRARLEILVIGGGIGGLTLALSLHQVGIRCRAFEAAPEIQPLGVGINLLPHGMRELIELGLERGLARLAVETRELCFYNRFGQHIFTEPRGRHAGYEWPQLSIHRGDLHAVLLEADVPAALKAYEAARLKPAYDVVLMNRANPPDAILREVWQRTGDRPFARIEDVIGREELVAMSESYKLPGAPGFQSFLSSLKRRRSMKMKRLTVKRLTGIALATAAAGLFALGAVGPAGAASHAGAAADKMDCKGVNDCKGLSDCKTGSGNCKGLNDCKGKGMKVMSKADCDKAKAAMKK